MWKSLIVAMMVASSLYGGVADATPPDTSSMPELELPQATPPEEVSAAPVIAFTATAASDYIFRGISQTENQPAVFGSGRISYDTFYAGAGIENVNFHNGTAAEYDLSAGWTPVIDKFRLDLGVVRYGYAGQPAHSDIDTVEVKGVVTHDFGPMTFGAAVYYSGNYFGSHRDDVYYEGRGTYRITHALSLSGAVGQQSGGLKDHTTWKAGGSYALTKHVGLDLRYSDTDHSDLGKIYGSHFTAAIKASF